MPDPRGPLLAVQPPPAPVRPGPLGKCAPCLDRAIMDGGPVSLAAVPDAIVLVTVLQPFSPGGGQTVMAPSFMGACLACRMAQMGTVSRTGLVRG